MNCLIAIENEGGNAELVRENLQRMFPEWTFEVCTDARALDTHTAERPDVVLVSRFLPGGEPKVLLRYLPVMFPASHIVLLVGRVDEDCKAYMRAAQDVGLTNIVTGILPGDRPYTVPVALTSTRDGAPVDLDDGVEAEEPSPAPTYPLAEEAFPGHERRITGVTQPVQDLPYRPAAGVHDPVSPRTPKTANAHTVPPDSVRQARSRDPRPMSRKQGVLVVTVANKGGAGKTTTAVTTGIALALAGVDVIIADLDFAGPDVGSFFGIKAAQGIEALAGRQSVDALMDHTLVPTKYEHLRILPGPVDKSIPPQALFQPGELRPIIEALLARADVVICDTPAGFRDRPWLPEVFEAADLVLAVVDQSKFSEEDTRRYAPELLFMGAEPERIRLVLNKFSPKLHRANVIESAFCAGFSKNVPRNKLPRVVATIPEDWDAHNLAGYKAEVVGLDDPRSAWHKLAKEIAALAGEEYTLPGKEERKGGGLLGGLLRRPKRA
ncbi:MAG: ParA family protein [Thermoanaerobacterales bacterium]|nr:ParA family protein [Thermoanaerobacterales bacterium]